MEHGVANKKHLRTKPREKQKTNIRREMNMTNSIGIKKLYIARTIHGTSRVKKEKYGEKRCINELHRIVKSFI